ncbi:hypothetical protein C1H46_019256 [Malus baccata]|uniref:Uncharacterized protein n=1 Tax=Malus baccata TaxID=106549 RepID=A0A540M9N2_MALBA|nr:hypothetical protein C1H46_019256 [Malus baccata]
MVYVQEEVAVMCLDDGSHQEKVASTSVAEVAGTSVTKVIGTCVNEVEDVQVAQEGGLEDVQVAQEVDNEEADEKDVEEDSNFVESEYRTDEDNLKFVKFEGIEQENEE